jgi:hypothetical protein
VGEEVAGGGAEVVGYELGTGLRQRPVLSRQLSCSWCSRPAGGWLGS